MRLSKALSEAGIASRRAAEVLITEGKITVNGKKAKLPQEQVDWKKDQIFFKGKRVTPQKRAYFVFNKPKNVVCSCLRKDREKIVLDYFPSHLRLFPVGRLDKNTTGLLLLTTDGDFCQKVIHPSKDIEKEYHLTVENLTPEKLEKMKKPIFIEGRRVRPVKVFKLNKYSLSVVVKEGKKHEVRLMAKKADLKLVSLKRVRIGSFRLGRLPEGMFRELSEKEGKKIFALSS